MNRQARSVLFKALLVATLALPLAAMAKDKDKGGKHHLPEFDPAAAGAIAAVIVGGGVLLARRRRSS